MCVWTCSFTRNDMHYNQVLLMWLISYKSRVILPSVFNTLNVMFKWGTKVGSTTAMMVATDNNTGSNLLLLMKLCWHRYMQQYTFFLPCNKKYKHSLYYRLHFQCVSVYLKRINLNIIYLPEMGFSFKPNILIMYILDIAHFNNIQCQSRK